MIKALGNAILLTPLMLIPMAAYTAVGIAGPIERELFTVTMMSGATPIFVLGHVLILLGALCLLAEIVKSLSFKRKAKFEFMVSLVLLLAGVLGFVLINGYGNPVFLILVVFQFIDVLAGSTIMTKTAERDLSIGG